jgi:cytochrome P450
MIFQTVHTGALFISINRFGIFPETLKRLLVPKHARDVRIRNHELVHQKLLRRLDTTPTYTDLMQNMVRAYESGKLELDSLAANSRVLIIAGSKTTASLLSGAFTREVANRRAYR